MQGTHTHSQTHSHRVRCGAKAISDPPIQTRSVLPPAFPGARAARVMHQLRVYEAAQARLGARSARRRYKTAHLSKSYCALGGYLRYLKKTQWTMRKSTAFTTTGEHHAWLIVIYMRRLNDGIGRRLRDRSVRSHSSTRSIRAIWKRPGKHILWASIICGSGQERVSC